MGCKRGSIGFFQGDQLDFSKRQIRPAKYLFVQRGRKFEVWLYLYRRGRLEGCWKGSEYTKVNIKREYIHRRRERI